MNPFLLRWERQSFFQKGHGSHSTVTVGFQAQGCPPSPKGLATPRDSGQLSRDQTRHEPSLGFRFFTCNNNLPLLLQDCDMIPCNVDVTAQT